MKKVLILISYITVAIIFLMIGSVVTLHNSPFKIFIINHRWEFILGIIAGLFSGMIIGLFSYTQNKKVLFKQNQQEYEKYLERMDKEVEIAFDSNDTTALKRVLVEDHTFYGFSNVSNQVHNTLEMVQTVIQDIINDVNKETLLSRNRSLIHTKIYRARLEILKMENNLFRGGNNKKV